MVIETTDRTTTFPEAWDQPFDDGEAFMFDPMHTPFPLTPLTQSALGAATGAGFTAAAAEHHLPILEFQIRHRNHFHFTRIIMRQPANDEEARQMGEATESIARAEIGRMMERWHGEHLPRILALHQRMAEMEVQGATSDDLLAMLDEAKDVTRELWLIHFRLAFPMLLSMQLYDELFTDLFGGTEADAHALLVGGVSASVKAGLGLFDLAVAAQELGLAQIIRDSPPDALLPALQSSEPGKVLLAKVHDYLEEFGLRQDLFELATPTWQEDPAFALASIRNYVLSGRDARADQAEMACSAEEALQAAREQLARYPEAVRGQFEAMVQFARQGAFLQEEHNFYIDQRGIALLRGFFQKVGAWLVDAGWLADSDDVFMLNLDELREIISGDATADGVARVQRLLGARRDELALAQTLTPPPFIGPPPAGPPAGGNPMERAMIRFFGGPPQQSTESGQLKGTAGSRGIVTGVARVARSLVEAQALLPGEILVAVTTMPPWTPLFGVAAAVVTETGGPLSHCAIVAREYGIPAVVGAFGATRAIATGQTITVDGGLGTVSLDA